MLAEGSWLYTASIARSKQGEDMKSLIGVVLLVVVLAAGGSFYLRGGNKITESQVRALYLRADQALAAGDDKPLCEMLSKDYVQTTVTKTETQQAEQRYDREQYCASLAQSMSQLRQFRETFGGRMPLRYEQKVNSISIASDGRSAEVEVSAIVEMAGVRMVSRGRDTVERSRWRTYMTGSRSITHVGRM
ncbi:MAG: hypothetical protein DI584_08970 [Stenotrophomonas sp.]|jgi:hypothetical protein|nr:MAG: hypothetical protein DI584_08970 [Stenotrophomonas sp.]